MTTPTIDAARLMGRLSAIATTIGGGRQPVYNAVVDRRPLSREGCLRALKAQERATQQTIDLMSDLRAAMRVAGDDRTGEIAGHQ